MAECGSPEEEFERAVENTEKRSQPRAKAEAAVEPEPETVLLDEPAAAVILPDSERLPVPELEPVKHTRRRVKAAATTAPEADMRGGNGEASIATVPPAAEAVKKTRAPRKRAVKAADVVKVATVIAVDPVTGEPLEG
jgi:hypothetical protein